MIYADFSATSINKPQILIDKTCEALSLPLGNPSRGSNRLAIDALKAMHRARKTVAAFFNQENPLKLGFSFGGTHSLNLAINGILSKNDHAITTLLEHNSVLRPLYKLRDEGMGLDFIPLEENGLLKLDEVENLLRPNTKAIVLNLMSNVTGDIAPLDFFKEFAKKHKLYLILDASQAGGLIPLNLNSEDKNILLALTGHKSLYGPRGIGALISYGIDEMRPLLSGGSGMHSFDERHPSAFPDVCEAGTQNLIGAIGLAASIEYLSHRDRKADFEHYFGIKRHFRQEAKKIRCLKLYGSDEKSGPIISVNIKDLPSSELALALEDEFDILTRHGAHCAPLVHRFFGTENQGMVRFSFGLSSTLAEVDTCLEALEKIAKNN